jgi:hypothetical protein
MCAVIFRFFIFDSLAFSEDFLIESATQQDAAITVTIIPIRILRPSDLDIFLKAFLNIYIVFSPSDIFGAAGSVPPALF